MIANILKLLMLTVVRNNNILEVYRIKNKKENKERSKESIHYFEIYKLDIKGANDENKKVFDREINRIT